MLLRRRSPAALLLVLAACTPPPAQQDAGPPAAEPGELTVVTGESLTGFADGVGRAARFAGITCMELAPDGATLYVADTFNGTVRSVDTQTAAVTTLAGAAQKLSTSDGIGAEARFTGPRGLGLSPDGATLFAADGPTLRRIDVATGAVTLVAGVASEEGYVDGSALEARLGYLLHDLAVTSDGSQVLIADRSNDVIRAMDVESEALSTLAGGGAPGVDGVGDEAGFIGPGGLALAGGSVYVADTFSHTLRSLDLTTREVLTVAGQRGVPGQTDGALDTALLNGPQGVATFGASLFATGFDGVLRRVDVTAGEVATVVGNSADARAVDGSATEARLGGAFAPPVIDEERGLLYYADLDAGSVRVVDLDTFAVSTLAGPVAPRGLVDGTLEHARFGRLYGVTATRDGARVYVADTDNGAVRLVERREGRVSTIIDTGIEAPVGLALDEENGRLFVSDAAAGRIVVVTLASQESAPLGAASFDTPWGVAYDGDGYLYVAEYGGAAVSRVHVASGEQERLAGSGVIGSDDGVGAAASFEGPVGVAYDDGRLFVSDFEASALRVVDVRSGEVSTLAGRAGEPGYRDGNDARFDGPSGLSFYEGALLVADAYNHVVRRIDPGTGETSTVLGDAATPGNLGFGGRTSVDTATLYEPEAMVVTDDGLLLVSEHALFLAEGALP